jgi:hypothetical protein
MARNILIFSDGTGQAGGILPDEKRSNIYKLFRATRCGPDTDIDPGQQLTFYDAGLGSEASAGAFFLTRAYRWLRKIASQPAAPPRSRRTSARRPGAGVSPGPVEMETGAARNPIRCHPSLDRLQAFRYR